jgi:beta-lactamase regulating signal transducer with metallopeptidase domain
VIEATKSTALTTNAPFAAGEPVLLRSPVESANTTGGLLPSVIQLNTDLALILIGLYGVFVLYRGLRLAQAWQTTRKIRRAALELEADDNIAGIINKCESDVATGTRHVRVLRSETLPVPVTMGLAQPVIILPDALLREGNTELLTSAIGHEFIHVARNDYVLNFIYELIYLPVSFHPAAALLRRRIKQTRELCCDELVAARILNAEVYARSLLRLAGSAPNLRQLSVTTTVGIADADILEARIMSLLRKPKMTTRWKKMLLVVVSILLLVPCVAAAAFNLRFDLETVGAQDPAPGEEKVKKTELAKQERSEIERRREFEMEMSTIRQAALVKLARINMDQAIQVATSLHPGKVLLASLDAKGWEEPGKLGKDGVVFYHVMVADENGGGGTHVFVNAIDGTVLRTEKELPRKQRSPEDQ